MTTKADLRAVTDLNIDDLPTERLFELKKDHDRYIEDALKRCMDIHKPVESE